MSVSNLDDLKSRRLWTACLAELIGTMLLVLIACGACYGGNVVQIALSFGFTVATVVWAIGHVSGGHINPAVTMGFIAARRMTIVRGLLYMVAQTLGALAGAGILKGLSPDNTPQGTVGISDNNGVSVGQGFGIELMISFVLVFVVFSCVDSQRSDLGGSVPLTVGLSIAICHLWAVRYFSHTLPLTSPLSLISVSNLTLLLLFYVFLAQQRVRIESDFVKPTGTGRQAACYKSGDPLMWLYFSKKTQKLCTTIFQHSLVQIMRAWRRPSVKPLSEPMNDV